MSDLQSMESGNESDYRDGFEDFESNTKEEKKVNLRKKFGLMSGRQPATVLMANLKKAQSEKSGMPPLHLGKMYPSS